jgi:hypothetical protein
MDAVEILARATTKARAASAYQKGGMMEDAERCYGEAVELTRWALGVLEPAQVGHRHYLPGPGVPCACGYVEHGAEPDGAWGRWSPRRPTANVSDPSKRRVTLYDPTT